MSLKGRHFLTLKDFTPEEIRQFLDLSKELKEKKKNGVVEKPLEGKNIALIFEKTSLIMILFSHSETILIKIIVYFILIQCMEFFHII